MQEFLRPPEFLLAHVSTLLSEGVFHEDRGGTLAEGEGVVGAQG